jgi:NitT/TauT family transport system substrate-binding protein
MIRKLLYGLCLTGAAFGAPVAAWAQDSSSQDLTPITFLTNYAFHGRHSPYFVGVEKGFYEKAGFDVEIQPATGSGFVVSAIDSDQADYGMADAGTVMQAIAKGAGVKAFTVFMDVTTSGLAALEPYPTPDSLQGATIAASLTDSARVIVPIIFDQKGLDPATIDWQAADPGVYISLLLSGQVDLYTASIDGDVPALTAVASKQDKEVHFSSFADWGYDVFGYFLITQPERIANEPDQVGSFAAATVEAVQYAIANPEETARIMVQHNPTLNYDTTLAQWRQSIKAIKTDYVQEHGYGAATPERIERNIALIKRALELEATPTVDEVFATGFVGE